MLAKLTRYQQDVNTSAQRCYNLGTTDTTPRTSTQKHPQLPVGSSAFAAKAADVNQRLADAVSAVEAQLLHISDNTVQWEAADKLRTEYAQWLEAKVADIEANKLNPKKLHNDVAELELTHLQVRPQLETKRYAIF